MLWCFFCDQMSPANQMFDDCPLCWIVGLFFTSALTKLSLDHGLLMQRQMVPIYIQPFLGMKELVGGGCGRLMLIVVVIMCLSSTQATMTMSTLVVMSAVPFPLCKFDCNLCYNLYTLQKNSFRAMQKWSIPYEVYFKIIALFCALIFSK